MGLCGDLTRALVALFFVGAMCVCGGVFNHLRGSNGGTMLDADAFSSAISIWGIAIDRCPDR